MVQSKRRTLLVALATVMFISVPTAFADFVPSWRGQNGSTYQAWSFGDANHTPLPDEGVSNDYGNPLLRVDTVYDWISDGGVWALSGELDIYIPNRDMRLDQKLIQLQLAWRPGNRDDTFFLPDEPIVGITSSPLFEKMEMSRQDSLEGGWTNSVFSITLWPNVDKEWFTIKGDIEVDGVIIDTICVPEPATIALLGMGTLAMIKSRRRFKSA